MSMHRTEFGRVSLPGIRQPPKPLIDILPCLDCFRGIIFSNDKPPLEESHRQCLAIQGLHREALLHEQVG